METYRARDLFREIAEAAWLCGDPGLQFDTTVNDWHTCPNTDAHQRLQPVLRVHVPRRHGLQPGVAEPDALPQPIDGGFDVEAFQHAVDVTLLAQEIIVGFTPSTPPSRSSKNAHDYRPLGLGYANLGALLMASGLPYDSDAGPRLRRRPSPR